MVMLRVHNLAVSLDGFATGEDRTVQAPFGHAGGRLMEWFTPTHTFVSRVGPDIQKTGSGSYGADDVIAAAAWQGIGAEIMGRGKFGPQQGPWADESWRGWWGDEPPFETPVVVLTHYGRPDLTLGKTTFLFRELAPVDALALATSLANGLDVRLGGGPTVVREFLAADLVDQLHVVVVPILLGRGVRLWTGLESLEDRFDIDIVATGSGVVHYLMTRKPGR